MVRSGLTLVYTLQECHIVQNLVYYIERAYRIRDYGMWAQGHRDDTARAELSASSIGMTVAALQLCDGLNLFGERCSSETVLFVDPDAMYRNVDILHHMLPRESKSKDADAALITTRGFPAFVVEHSELRDKIEENINTELLGKYGYKRFIGDTFGSDSPDINPENQVVQSLTECQWPFIVLFQIMTCVFEGRVDQITKCRSIINPLLYDSSGFPTLPQYYRFDKDSEAFVAVKDTPVVVFQSMLLLTDILEKNLVHPSELDSRKLNITSSHKSGNASVIQISLLSESMSFQGLLSTYGVTTQTPNQIESVFIWPSAKLVDLLYHHGSDVRLGLTGRPKRPLGPLCTSRVWKIGGKTVVCVPLFLDKQDFYLSKDESYIADSIKIHLKFLRANWKHTERPTFIILLTPALFKTNSKPLLSVLDTLKSGTYKDILLKVGRLQELIPIARIMEIQPPDTHISFNANRILSSPTLTRKSLSMKSLNAEPTNVNHSVMDLELNNDYETIVSRCHGSSDTDLGKLTKLEPPSSTNVIALIELANRPGADNNFDDETVEELIEYYYRTIENDWLALRCGAAFLCRTVDSLAPALSTIIVSGRSLSMGVYGYPQFLIQEPMNPNDLREMLHKQIREHNIMHVSLQQEFLIYLAQMLMDHPDAFTGILVVRIGYIINILQSILAPKGVHLEALSPHSLNREIRNFLSDSHDASGDTSWQRHRQINGMLGRVPHNFYTRVWMLLQHQQIEFIGKDQSLLVSRDGKNRKPDSATFAITVETFLDKFKAEYRYLVIELFNILSCTIERNDAVNFVKKFDLMAFIEKSGVETSDSAATVSKKFLDCLIKLEFAKLVDISDCILS